MTLAVSRIILSTVFILTGCTESADSDSSKDPAEVPRGADTRRDRASIDEDEKMDHPVMVSGTFLTCAIDPNIQVRTLGDEAVGCRLERDLQKISLRDIRSITWKLIDRFNIEVDGRGFRPQASSSAWHVAVDLPIEDIDKYKVAVDVQVGETGRSFITKIAGDGTKETEDEPAGGAGDTIAESQTYPRDISATEYDFYHLGNNRFRNGANSDCVWVEPEGKRFLSGRTIRIPFEVARPTRIAFSLPKICGARYRSNRVRVMRGANVINYKYIPSGDSSLALAGALFSPGRYSLDLVSGKSGGDSDDYVISAVVFTVDAEVVIGAPLIDVAPD